LIDIVVKNGEDIDRNELVNFMNIRSETDKKEVYSPDLIEKYVDSLLDSIAKYNVLAYLDNELSGWIGLIEANPSLMILFEWHPLVLLSEHKNHLAQNLLQEAFQFTKNKGISNVRAFVDVNQQREKPFQELQALYASVQMKKTHVHNCMEHILSPPDIKDIQTPPNMTITSLANHKMEELLDCYHKIFENSLDDFVNSLNDEERIYWNFLNLDEKSESSAVLEHNGNVIGFVGARDYGNCIEFGPVGLLQEYRGRGLSKIIMNHSFSSLISLNKLHGYLEVGERNLPAFNLYSKYGFKVVSKKHGFLIRLNEYPKSTI
jgi:ribosomal-protein-alanine N-acetyltransferase